MSFRYRGVALIAICQNDRKKKKKKNTVNTALEKREYRNLLFSFYSHAFGLGGLFFLFILHSITVTSSLERKYNLSLSFMFNKLTVIYLFANSANHKQIYVFFFFPRKYVLTFQYFSLENRF